VQDYLTWRLNAKLPANNSTQPHCAVCRRTFPKHSFIFTAGEVLELCKADAKRLAELGPIEREEAIRQIVERVAPAVMDLARVVA
jgi:hypothetical protein